MRKYWVWKSPYSGKWWVGFHSEDCVDSSYLLSNNEFATFDTANTLRCNSYREAVGRLKAVVKNLKFKGREQHSSCFDDYIFIEK